jgi:hypothetical protein
MGSCPFFPGRSSGCPAEDATAGTNSEESGKGHMSAVEYRELDELSGELIPGKFLLSLIDFNMDNSRHTTFNFPQGGGGGGTVAYACHATHSQSGPDPFGALGLGSSSSMTCIPAAVSSR